MSDHVQSPPHFHENTLHTIPATHDALRQTLEDLSRAIDKGCAILKTQCPPNPVPDDEDIGTIFSGQLGIAITLLRLHRQRVVVHESTGINVTDSLSSASPVENYIDLASKYCPLPTAEDDQAPQNRTKNTSVSPITSVVSGPAFTRLLAALHGAAIFPCLRNDPHDCQPEVCPVFADLRNVELEVDEALQGPSIVERNGHRLGRDEVLIGRAGMMWALRCLCSAKNFFKSSPLLEDASLGNNLNSIMKKGKQLLHATLSEGSRHGTEHKLEADAVDVKVPLLWPWLNQYYGLGAMHGATGILANVVDLGSRFADIPNTCDGIVPEVTNERIDSSTLVDIKQENHGLDVQAIEPYLDGRWEARISSSVEALCDIALQNGGHLPMSLPAMPSRTQRSSPLVQICHGAPGLLAMLAIGLKNPSNQRIWQDDLARRGRLLEAFDRTSQVVWEEGLLRKGGGLCHGIAGNSWAWLALSTCDWLPIKYADQCLGRALAFLLEARDTRPFVDYDDSGKLVVQCSPNESTKESEAPREYALPEKPFGLFTGLAGTLAMWSEACVVMRWHMRRLEIHASTKTSDEHSDVLFASLRHRDPIVATAESAMLGFPGLS